MRKIVCDLCKKDIPDYMIHEATSSFYSLFAALDVNNT